MPIYRFNLIRPVASLSITIQACFLMVDWPHQTISVKSWLRFWIDRLQDFVNIHWLFVFLLFVNFRVSLYNIKLSYLIRTIITLILPFFSIFALWLDQQPDSPRSLDYWFNRCLRLICRWYLWWLNRVYLFEIFVYRFVHRLSQNRLPILINHPKIRPVGWPCFLKRVS